MSFGTIQYGGSAFGSGETADIVSKSFGDVGFGASNFGDGAIVSETLSVTGFTSVSLVGIESVTETGPGTSLINQATFDGDGSAFNGGETTEVTFESPTITAFVTQQALEWTRVTDSVSAGVTATASVSTIDSGRVGATAVVSIGSDSSIGATAIVVEGGAVPASATGALTERLTVVGSAQLQASALTAIQAHGTALEPGSGSGAPPLGAQSTATMAVSGSTRTTVDLLTPVVSPRVFVIDDAIIDLDASLSSAVTVDTTPTTALARTDTLSAPIVATTELGSGADRAIATVDTTDMVVSPAPTITTIGTARESASLSATSTGSTTAVGRVRSSAYMSATTSVQTTPAQTTAGESMSIPGVCATTLERPSAIGTESGLGTTASTVGPDVDGVSYAIDGGSVATDHSFTCTDRGLAADAPTTPSSVTPVVSDEALVVPDLLVEPDASSVVTDLGVATDTPTVGASALPQVVGAGRSVATEGPTMTAPVSFDVTGSSTLTAQPTVLSSTLTGSVDGGALAVESPTIGSVGRPSFVSDARITVDVESVASIVDSTAIDDAIALDSPQQGGVASTGVVSTETIARGSPVTISVESDTTIAGGGELGRTSETLSFPITAITGMVEQRPPVTVDLDGVSAVSTVTGTEVVDLPGDRVTPDDTIRDRRLAMKSGSTSTTSTGANNVETPGQ
jgi:hypothetical protein